MTFDKRRPFRLMAHYETALRLHSEAGSAEKLVYLVEYVSKITLIFVQLFQYHKSLYNSLTFHIFLSSRSQKVV